MTKIILSPFSALLGWFYSLTGSYGLAIILFSLVFKIILFPISIRGRRSMLDMSRLGNRQKDLQQKYGQDRQRYSIELQKLYDSEGVKASGGCLWSLIPMPILMALYFIISQPFTHLMKLTTGDGSQLERLTQFIQGSTETAARNSQLSIAQDVYTRFDEVQAALPDVAEQILAQGGPIDFTFFGINLSATPNLFFWRDGLSWESIGLALIPILSAVFALGSMMTNTRINKLVLGDDAQKDNTQNKQMMFMQPLLSLWLGFTLPAALGVYWASNSVFAILQEFCSIGILRKHVNKKREESAQRAITQKEEQRVLKQREAEQKKKKAEEARRIKMERKLNTDGISESRVGMRAYAKGRTFDQDRYPVTPYHDPDDMIKEQREARKLAQEQATAAAPKKEKKKNKDSSQDEEVSGGMILNGEGEARPAVTPEPIEEAPETDTADHGEE